MKNKITSNMTLKLISLFLAVVMWLLVTSIDDPTIPYPFYNVKVQLLNKNLITDSGQVCEVLDDTDVISKVVVYAPRSIGGALTADNVKATADVSELSSLDTITVKFSTDIYSNQISSDNIKASSDTVKLNIENKKAKALAITATTSGNVESGYVIGDVSLEQNQVRLSGPESIISKITKAVVDVDVTGFTSDIGTDADIKLYDEDGNIVKSESVIQNINVARVKVNILQTKDIPVNYHTSGKPLAGYRATGVVTGDVETVAIAGKSSVLKNINAIDIPETVLDLTGQSENYMTEIDVRKYLPENVSLVKNSKSKINVTVFIEREISKKMEIRSEKVTVSNIPEGYEASISGLDETFMLEALGLASEVGTIQAGNVSGTVDVQKWLQEEGMSEPVEGYYTVDVDFGFPENVTLLEPITVTLHLTKIEE